MSGINIDNLPPTQQLILDVLAARYRLGEQVWPLHTTVQKPLRELADRGLVTLLNGIVEKSIRARLTDAGQALTLHEQYQPPNGGIGRYRQALEDIRAFAVARSERPGMDGIAELAGQALKVGPR
ncbi:hypothetical protein ACWT_5694 [Actinoplanes sp. SE50]|uniref:hypothetical protein n=1 Tax=unclassified Actinoplanes TaxID=2626549 RepID=UPI00023ED2DD|nr:MULTISPECIES: hypothetical protein [unclassified Actinoplanes]AEV86711.1 hypothetical protein ACPL_5824 [Actinoplanes sp. SE50/110]ATO85109.1 hypothetical protein ACWT_5694 [Actinoplanes sp. SE50]SLM02520.1 hypothetical protein ACSP50_5770 [Actinoplanes sp. SE50/110]